MLAASQLAITVFSLLLGRLGEPAVARLLERPIELVGLPPAAVPPVALVVALLLVVVAHMLLGEMVPRNIALAGPERAAMLLVPPFLLFTTAVGPAVGAVQPVRPGGAAAAARATPATSWRTAFTSGELAVMIAESRREGLLDDAESVRLTRTLRAADATVADVLVPRDELVSLPPQPGVGDVTAAVAATGFSRFPVRSPAGDSWVGLPAREGRPRPGRPAPGRRRRRAGPPAAGARAARGGDDRPASTTRWSILRASRAHLARAVDPAGATVGLVALEDLVEVFVGTVRDATHRQG